MDQIGSLDAFGEEIGALERDLGQAQAMTTAFSASLREVQGSLGETTRDLGNLERGFSGGLKRAFDGLVMDGMKLSDALGVVARAMSQTVYNAAVKPVTDHLGSLLAGGLNSVVSGLMPFASGGSFAQGRVMPFASGGIVSGPTAFPMRGGTGLMGEAGPEAIMPLARGADGRLGVRTQGGQAVSVTINIATPDVRGFERSQSQIAASVARALSAANRNR
jgi:phage-related minor tail protein